MPQTGPISKHGDDWSCRCGAPASSIDIMTLTDMRPVAMPGHLLGPCSCPKCIGCGWALDDEQRCDNLDCPLVGTLIVIPD